MFAISTNTDTNDTYTVLACPDRIPTATDTDVMVSFPVNLTEKIERKRTISNFKLLRNNTNNT